MKRRNFLQSTLMVAGAAIVGTPLLTKAEPIHNPNIEIELTFYLEYIAVASGALAREETRTVYLADTQLIISEHVENNWCTKEFRFKDKTQRNDFINRLVPVLRSTEIARREYQKTGNGTLIPFLELMDSNWVHELQRHVEPMPNNPDFQGRINYIGPQVIRWCYRGEYGDIQTSPYRNEVYNVPLMKGDFTLSKFKHIQNEKI